MMGWIVVTCAKCLQILKPGDEVCFRCGSDEVIVDREGESGEET